MSADQELADLLASRILHDIVNPVGAVANSAELLGMVDIAPAEVCELLDMSVASATAVINFMRVAFGAAPPSAMTSAHDLRDTFHAYHGSARSTLELNIDADLPRSEAQLAALGYLGLSDVLVSGGTIRIAHSGEGLELIGQADKLFVDEAAWAWLGPLDKPTAQLEARQVHFPYLRRKLDAQGRQPQLEIFEQSIRLAY